MNKKFFVLVIWNFGSVLIKFLGGGDIFWIFYNYDKVKVIYYKVKKKGDNCIKLFKYIFYFLFLKCKCLLFKISIYFIFNEFKRMGGEIVF